MAEFYAAGEIKPRPGIYQRYVNRGSVITPGAETGITAIPIKASWGPLGKVTVHEKDTSIKNTYGTGETTDAAVSLFEGGARKVFCIRMGENGKCSSLELKNNAEGSETLVTVTAKYPGTRPLSVQIRKTSADTTEKEIVIYDGTSKLETFSFDCGLGADEGGNLVEAVSQSEYISAAKAGDTTDKTLAIVGITALTGGSNPEITTESYSKALNTLETYVFNYIALDSVKPEHQAILVSWLERVYGTGKLVIAVLGGDNSDKDFETLKAAAESFDNKQIVYSGIYGTDANGNKVDGYRMAALVCGAIAGTATTESIVHKTVPGIAEITPFTNKQYETAINSGLLLASISSDGTVWFDSGVNTLKNPAVNEDSGWKKIRRVATRFELMQRIDTATAPLIGQINCDKNGVAIIIQTAQGVLNDMVAEGKLVNGAIIYEDTENPYSGESAWFVIEADDIDSFEKGYFRYMFRFNQNS